MEKTKKQVVGMSIIVLTLMIICSCFFVTAGFVDGLPAATVTDDGSSSGGGGGSTAPVVVNATDNETVSDDKVSEGEGDEGVSEGGITEGIKDGISGAVSYVKQFWIWFAVGVILLIAIVVYFKRKKKQIY